MNPKSNKMLLALSLHVKIIGLRLNKGEFLMTYIVYADSMLNIFHHITHVEHSLILNILLIVHADATLD